MKKRAFIRNGTFWVYILQCQDGTYYTGYTNNLDRRLKQHKTGKGGALYTKWKKAETLVWTKQYCRFKPAYLMEMRIKALTRLQKEALVKGIRLERVLAKAGK
ncbi:MAG: GIY-YIG nuclease family protein [Candidatus Omnitrophica bacterium]|nr:GIY-YIG nuclease family protein [Candidatus Omnitrophota bacterium]